MKLLKKEPPDIQRPKKARWFKGTKSKIVLLLIQQFSIKYETVRASNFIRLTEMVLNSTCRKLYHKLNILPFVNQPRCVRL